MGTYVLRPSFLPVTLDRGELQIHVPGRCVPALVNLRKRFVR